jgi:enterochelin esterase-like enzyme
MPATIEQRPRVNDEYVELALSDARLGRVALLHELRRPRRVEFVREGRIFRLRFPRPDADRLEYLLELTTRSGRARVVPDPTNPLRARGPFGEKSVIEFPGYEPPEWLLDGDSTKGDLRELPLRSRRLGTVPALLWAAAETDPDARLPLLVVHDGPEYADYSSLLQLLDHLVDFGETPEFRALLLPPGPRRDELYSASTRYANALVRELLPAALVEAPSEHRPALLAASLGALAAVHVHFLHPGTFGGVFLQSGSFFRRRFDAHESRFPRFGRIARFVGQVHGRRQARPIPTVLTCGTAEENLANNRALASALEERDWPLTTFWNRDAHNWTAWRDALHPHLAELLLRAWT